MEKDYSKLKEKRVLVVDDNESNVYAMTATLEYYDMEVVAATDGQAAIDKLESDQNIDVVLMDIMMPNMDGYEAIKKIRENEKLKDIPIITVTAQAMKQDRQKSLDAGANDYFAKPIDGDTLVEALIKLL